MRVARSGRRRTGAAAAVIARVQPSRGRAYRRQAAAVRRYVVQAPGKMRNTTDSLHRARALANIGLHDGLPQWAYAVELQRSRLRQLQAEGRRLTEILSSGQAEQLASLSEDMAKWNAQLVADGHFLLIAVRHILQLGRRLRDRTAEADHRADTLLQAFVGGEHGRAELVRGILEHFDRYWIEGKQDPRRGMRGWPRPVLANIGVDAELYLRVGQNRLDLLALADDAVELAVKLYEVWAEVTPPAFASDMPDPPDDLTYLDVLLETDVGSSETS
jgi:hypothetical protein